MRRRGFTLLELLLVIAILVVLVAVVAPNIFSKGQSAIEDARFSTFASNYGMIMTAVRLVEWKYPCETNGTTDWKVDWNSDGDYSGSSEEVKPGAWNSSDTAFLKVLVRKGYLTPEAVKFPTKSGATKYFVMLVAKASWSEDDKIKFDLGWNTNNYATDTEGRDGGIRAQLVGGATLRSIWDTIQ